MPWSKEDATKHTKKADTPKKKRQWQAIANQMLAEGKPEANAIRAANSVIRKRSMGPQQ